MMSRLRARSDATVRFRSPYRWPVSFRFKTERTPFYCIVETVAELNGPAASKQALGDFCRLLRAWGYTPR